LLLTDGDCRYEQLTLRADALREQLHTEIEKMLNDIIKFKVHVQKSLEDYEGFVVEEVEQELAGEGGVDAEMEEAEE
jgi:kinetochore protein NDC80